ncbi:DUF4148 domain-containing protein [Pararobbsia silviterrae]|nr:DUF4148 domain-containing protein [Pararobbsia silviterrae]
MIKKIQGCALMALAAVSLSVAHAASAQDVTRAQVQAQLRKAFLNGTLPQDEGPNYPRPEANRALVAAHRQYEAAHGAY